MRNNRGISLIALIVTVLIMFILLGVSVRYIFNEDGLVDNAKEAKEQVENKMEEQNSWTQSIIDEF